MRAVIRQVNKAAVSVDQQEAGKIGYGLLVLLNVHETGTQKDVDYLVKKITQIRISEDEWGKINISVEDMGGQTSSISRFTLFADTKKENRPSFVEAAQPETATPLYESFNEGVRSRGITVATGQFGADTSVSLVDDEPVTIIIDSKNK